MKTKLLFSAIAMVVILLSSCDKLEFGNEFLEKAPSGGDVTKDTIFNSYLFANRYLTAGYATLPYGVNTTNTGRGNKIGTDILESFTDLSHSYLSWGSMNRFYYNGLYGSAIEVDSPFDTKYSFTREYSWDGIRIGRNILENADRIPDAPNSQAITQMKGEAKMLIALHYCDMYRHYGGLPWVEKVYGADGIGNLPRRTSLETLNLIVELLDSAAKDLPWTMSRNDDGRFTKASALGLKARILLFGASPLFNNGTHFYEGSSDKSTWHGEYIPQLWQDAADAAKELIEQAEANGYGLVNTGNFRKDFQDAYYKRANGEVLISTRVRFAGLDFWNANYYFYQSASEYGTACPTQEYVDMFPMDNGKDINAQGSGYDRTNPYINRDPRLYETILVNGDTYQGRTAELYEGGRETTFGSPLLRTGYKLRKFLLDTDRSFSSVRGLPVHWPYLRLAEIYLSYAEALNEVSGPTDEAFAAVNKVRNRVGLPNLDLGPNPTKAAFTQAVLKERACEFGYEEVRWFDITRRKLEDKFKNQLTGVIIKATNAAKTNFSFTPRNLPVRAWSTNFSPKWYLSAFPATEVNKGYGLTQNPGW